MDVWDLSYAEWCSRRQMRQIAAFLRRRVPGFERAYVVQSGVQVGVRETRRVLGEYQLTVDDVLGARKFDDGIARGAYPVDIHNPKGSGTVLKRLPPGAAYDIPLRCLLPQGIDHLIVAGRCISGTHEAHSSYRVMPIAMATGQAAGVCAALATQRKTRPAPSRPVTSRPSWCSRAPISTGPPERGSGSAAVSRAAPSPSRSNWWTRRTRIAASPAPPRECGRSVDEVAQANRGQAGYQAPGRHDQDAVVIRRADRRRAVVRDHRPSPGNDLEPLEMPGEAEWSAIHRDGIGDLDHALRLGRGWRAQQAQGGGLDDLQRREKAPTGRNRHVDGATLPVLATLHQHGGTWAGGVGEGAEIAHPRPAPVPLVGDDQLRVAHLQGKPPPLLSQPAQQKRSRRQLHRVQVEQPIGALDQWPELAGTLQLPGIARGRPASRDPRDD